MQTMKRLIDRLAAMLLTAAVAACGLTACAGSEETAEEPTPAVKPTETTGERIYNVSIAATMGGAETRAVAIDQNAQGKDYLVSTFRGPNAETGFEGDPIAVYKIKEKYVWLAQDEDNNRFYLHADADAKEANLTGRLAFYDFYDGVVEVKTGDKLLLMYNGDGGNFEYDRGRENPDGTFGQKGTLESLSDYDYATAEVEITGISGAGTNESPYTLTTTEASFTNLQSMFKLTFTGMSSRYIGDNGGDGITKITIHSANNKLAQYNSPDTGNDFDGDIEITLGGYCSGASAARGARMANGAGNVVYAALRFQPLGETETDEITFNIEGTDPIPYIAKKTSPAGGFQNGKYYTATIAAMVDLSKVTSRDDNNVLYFAAHGGQTLTGSFSGYVTIPNGATVTLSDVNITAPSNCDHAAIHCLGSANIIVSGTGSNHVTAGSSSQYPAIYVPHRASGTENGLTISGTGTLIADGSSGSGAGIGGGEDKNCGKIEITGGNITAKGGSGAAGIGSGYGASCGNITISGGTVTAQGGEYAAGIGCGQGNDNTKSVCGDISIGAEGDFTSVTAIRGQDAWRPIGHSSSNSDLNTCGTIMFGSSSWGYTTIYWGDDETLSYDDRINNESWVVGGLNFSKTTTDLGGGGNYTNNTWALTK